MVHSVADWRCAPPNVPLESCRRLVRHLRVISEGESVSVSSSAAGRRLGPTVPGWVRVLICVAGVLLAGSLRAQAPNPSFTFSTGGSLAYSPAIGGDGTLYFGSRWGDVFAVQANGVQRWKVRVPQPIAAPVSLGSDDSVVVGGMDGSLRVFSSAGVPQWSFKTGGEIWGGAAIGADGAIYFGSRDRKCYALNPNGGMRWEFAAGGEVTESPALGADGTVYFSARNDRLYALAADGTVKWSYAVQQPGPAALGPDGTIYVGSSDYRLRALNPDGTLQWSYDTTASIRSSPTVAPDGRVFVASWNGEVRCLRPDGTLDWYVYMKDEARYSAVALGSDGFVYAVTVSGVLYSVNGNTGAARWSTSAQGRVDAGSPVISATGVVYFATDGGKVTGFSGASGPSAGSWPMAGRDARRSGGGFVTRELPPAFGAGAEMTVALTATVPAGTTFYSVEDTPPANWTTGAISHAGVFDAVNRRVKFGPFLDGVSRRLTYQVTPPVGDAGTKTFAGIATSDGGDRWVMGDQVIESIPLHPADITGVDGWLTLSELTAYGAAWRRGAAWTIPPAVVPASYLDRAIEIWLAGEAYRHDTNFGTAPGWWQPVRDGEPSYPPVPAAPGTAANGTIVSQLPATIGAGGEVEVTLTVTPGANVVVQAVEDSPPAGWEVRDISPAGVFDGYRGRIKWGPFFDAEPRVLAYRVTVPTNAAGTVVFLGAAGFDGGRAETTGARRLFVGEAAEAGIFVTRVLPERYSPGARMTVRLHSVPPTDSLYHLFEDSPPAGWAVTQVSDDGWFDASARKVRFGPFLDTLPRTVSYDVTPPASESGARQFSGFSAVNGLAAVIVGDSELNAVPLHPGDTQIADSWLTLSEMTAYGAAWKRGSTWPAPPSPIPPPYLTQAIELWRGGEAYVFDAGITNPPAWWVVSTNTFPPELAPPPIGPGHASTNGSVWRDAPRFFTNGVPVLLTLKVTPASDSLVYAVEEELPTGWELLTASDGVTNVTRGKLRWGPFFDAQSRTLTCELVATSAAGDVTTLVGHGAFDGLGGATSGRAKVFRAEAPLAPEFTAYRMMPGAGFEVTLKGLVGEAYLLSASTNLDSWQPLATLTNLTGTVKFLDPAATNLTQRHYRAVWP